MESDRAPEVVGISGQPFALLWLEGLKRRSQVPDLFVRYSDGQAVVIDCRSVERADEQFCEVAAITAGDSERAPQSVPVEAAS